MLSLLLAAEVAKLGAAVGYGCHGTSAREDGRPSFFYDHRRCIG